MSADWADMKIPRAIRDEMRKNLRRQQEIREGERRVRQDALPPPPVDPARLPIIFEEEAPYLIYGVTEEDIRAVLCQLPPGSLDGLREVRLCTDREDNPNPYRNRPPANTPKDELLVREPYTGRLRRELLPGLFASAILGTYKPSTAIIRLHAMVGETDPVLTLFWKVRVLETLVHEAAHHFDVTFRRGRSRWAAVDRDKEEAWVEQLQREQAREIIVPYIKTRYPAELDALDEWVERHGGTPFFAAHLIFLLQRPLLLLARSVLRGDDRETVRVNFARALHEHGVNDEAAAVLRSVYALRAEHPEALAVSACILNCDRTDHDEAERLCRRALALAPDCLEAWEVLVRGYAIQKRWREAAAACEDAISRTPAGDQPRRYFVSTLEEARSKLGD